MTSFVSISHSSFLTNKRSAIWDRLTSINMIYSVISWKQATSQNFRCYRRFCGDKPMMEADVLSGWEFPFTHREDKMTYIPKPKNCDKGLCRFSPFKFPFRRACNQQSLPLNLSWAVEVSEHLWGSAPGPTLIAGRPCSQLLHSLCSVPHRHKAIPHFPHVPFILGDSMLILEMKACSRRHLKPPASTTQDKSWLLHEPPRQWV